MAQSVTPPTIPAIPITRAVRSLSVGESCLVGPCLPQNISAVTCREPGHYRQFRVIVTEPRSAESVAMFIVTRID